MTVAQASPMARTATRSEPASSASRPPANPGPLRADSRQARSSGSPAALSSALRYRTSAGSSSPPGERCASCSALSRAARAAPTSTSRPSCASWARIDTRSSATPKKPPPTTPIKSPPPPPRPSAPSPGPGPASGLIVTTLPSTRMPSTGVWPVSTPMSPSRVLAMTRSAGPDHTSPSGTTSPTWRVTVLPRATASWCLPGAPGSRLLQVLGLLLHVLDPADHEERLLRVLVVLALGDGLERGDGLVQRDEHPRLAGELLGDEHRMRQEPLDPPGALHRDPVLLGQLVDAEDRDDVLQFLVPLQDPLHLARDVVVLLPDVRNAQDPRGRVERVHGGEDPLLGDLAGEHRGGGPVREHPLWRRVRAVVGGHVDRLHRGDRVASGRGDPLLQLAHLVGQRRLVAHRGRHPAQQRGYLRARLGEPEDVVDEQQHVLALDVAEVLGHRERGQADPQPGARRLVHLAEHQRGVLDHVGLGHLDEQVVALASPLADTREDRDAAEVLGDPGDHLLDQHGLADAGPAEQADLAAPDVRGEQVENLDPGLQDLGSGLELVERGRVPVDPTAFGDLQRGRRHVQRLPEA